MPTRLAILADVHADAVALCAAFSRIDAEGIGLVLCAGDLVDEGDDPEGTVAILRDRSIPTIRGNHDRWALERRSGGRPEHEAPSGDLYLSREAMHWIGSLPTRWDSHIDGVRVAMRHARHGSDIDGIEPAHADAADRDRWLRRAEADALVVGHTHAAWVLDAPHGRRIVNPGALGRGAGDVGGSTPTGVVGARSAGVLERGLYGVLELPSLRWRVFRAFDGSEVDLTETRSP